MKMALGLRPSAASNQVALKLAIPEGNGLFFSLGYNGQGSKYRAGATQRWKKSPHPEPLPYPDPPGESLTVEQVLSKTNCSLLWKDGMPMSTSVEEAAVASCPLAYIQPDVLLWT